MPVPIPFDFTRQFYEDLFASLLSYATIIHVVDDGTWANDGNAPLADYLRSSSRQRSWPGTELEVGDSRIVHSYSFVQALLPQFFRVFQDQALSALPLDVHLCRADGTSVLSTISSHNRSWLELSIDEWFEWSARYPDLAMALTDHVPTGEVIPLPGLLPQRIGEELDPEVIASLADRLDPKVRARVAHYLNQGSLVLPLGGETLDVLEHRFTVQGGGDILSDGRYCWRQDTSHYVDHYAVAIPLSAIAHFESSNWTPSRLSTTQIEQIEDYIWNDL